MLRDVSTTTATSGSGLRITGSTTLPMTLARRDGRE